MADVEKLRKVKQCIDSLAEGLHPFTGQPLPEEDIAGHFPSAVWQFPITSLGVILLFVSIAAIAAVYTPAKRIRNMSITATINEL